MSFTTEQSVNGLTIHRLSPRIGAEISGAALSGDLQAVTAKAIRDAILAR
jgi:alpha-ketoglutarate-dependent taurine dioxygenase